MPPKTSKSASEPKTIKKLADLAPDPLNANDHTERGSGMMEESIRECGFGDSLTVDKNGIVISGNQRLETLADIGLENPLVVQSDGSRPVIHQRLDLDLSKDARAKLLALYQNRVGEANLQWSPEMLRALQQQGIRLDGLWSEKELAALKLDATPPDEGPEPQIDKAAELQKKWKTALGQIWTIPSKTVGANGSRVQAHRIMCGDSRDAQAVARLMNGGCAKLMSTDPPYGIDYLNIIKSRAASKKSRFSPMENDTGTGEHLQDFLESVFSVALPHLIENAAWYIWHAQMTQGFFAAAAAAADLLIHRQIIWVKPSLIMGHGHYHWRHELCFYGWRRGNQARWFGDRKQDTVWEIGRDSEGIHPTQKPVELFRRPMRFNTELQDICYEPFTGSGTQFIAAEQLGRICYGMEIEPKYVAVALQRMADMGLQPRLLK
jgi:DNA modification methylase